MATPGDNARTAALVNGAFGGTRYGPHALELLSDPECVVIENERGALVYASIAGAADVIKLHLLVGDAQFLDGLPHARLAIAELPDDAPFAETTAALLANGFREEGRIDDFIADGIAMRFLVRRAD